MSDTWALCIDCSRWYYVARRDEHPAECPVCMQPPGRLVSEPADDPDVIAGR